MKQASYITLIIASIVTGIIYFAYRHRWLIVRLPFGTQEAVVRKSIGKRPVKIITLINKPTQELQNIIWHEHDPAANAASITNAYFSALDEENSTPKKISVTAAALGPTQGNLILSLSDSPLSQEMATLEKLKIIEGLFATLKEHVPSTSISFLVNHQPLRDYHLDFSQPLPIAGFTGSDVIAAPTITTNSPKLERLFTIMLDPAGDAQHTGRIIEDSFERGITLQCAQALKTALEAQHHALRVVLTRVPGEAVESLQNAAFANRLQADLYVHLGFYQTNSPVPELNIYYYTTNPAPHFWQRKTEPLQFIPYHQAHLAKIKLSKGATFLAAHTLQNTKPLAATVRHFSGIPFRPLVGIAAPACALEIGVQKKHDWQPLIAPLAKSIMQQVVYLSNQ